MIARTQVSAVLGAVIGAAVIASGQAFAVPPAQAASAWWGLTSGSRPTGLAPGTQGVVVASAADIGDAGVSGPVTITDRLPADLTTTGSSAVEFRARVFGESAAQNDLGPHGAYASLHLCTVAAHEVSCTYRGAQELEALGVPSSEAGLFNPLTPYRGRLEMRIAVNVGASAPLGAEQNEVSVSGGGSQANTVRRPLQISEAEAAFGIEDFQLRLEEEGGTPATQAGSHPFQITNVLSFNELPEVNHLPELSGNAEEARPVQQPRNLSFRLPPGLLGNVTALPRCTAEQFSTQDLSLGLIGISCPPQTQIGVATVTYYLPGFGSPRGQVTEVVPVFNLVPEAGEPARFGFLAGIFPVTLDSAVRSGNGEDYGVTVSVTNITQVAELLSTEVTFWGTPGDQRHDISRGYRCLNAAPGCVAAPEPHPKAFLILPTSCPANPLTEPFSSRVMARSWLEPADAAHPEASFQLQDSVGTPLGLDGCNRLTFAPRVQAQPTSDAASSPSGLTFDMFVDDEGLTSSEGLAQSQLAKAVVSLPVGVTTNPSVAAGLSACTSAQYESENVTSTPGSGCPPEAKIGTVEIESPLVAQKIEGSVYLAKQSENPFGSLLALYVVAKNPELGLLIRVAGKVEPDPVTGQLVTTFANLPQLPFSHFHFAFRQGQRAPLATPAACGTYTTTADLTPYSDPARVLHDTAQFTIVSGPEGSPCPSGGTPPFQPAVKSGTLNNAAGSFSPMYIQIARNDTEQEITRFSAQLPPGLSADLSGVPFCPDAAIASAKTRSGAAEESEPSCPAASQIGHTQVGVGVGSALAWSSGRLYLAGPYHGAPFSVVAVNSAKVGPFDLGTVVVREALSINPQTAVVTVDASASDPIPHILDGIVIHARDIRVYVDRPHFTLNPTNCAHLSLNALIGGAGADPSNPAAQTALSVPDPFQAADCQALHFKPDFKASTSGKTSKAQGASLTTRIEEPPGALGTQANISKVKVELPIQLPSRLTTLQKACLAAVFAENPANCPAASVVGHATAITPVLPVPLAGPAYFVSNGNAKFPELVIILQGYGVTIMLHGETFIDKHGITSSTFHAVPDQPVSSFELTLPQGPYSALTANANLCALTKLVTVKKRVTVHKHGRTIHMTRSVKRRVAQSLLMPTEFTAQNGAQLKQSTKIQVTGCPKPKPATKPKRKAKRKHR